MLQMEVGTGEETRGVMGEEERPVPGPSLGAKPPWAFPEFRQCFVCTYEEP